MLGTRESWCEGTGLRIPVAWLNNDSLETQGADGSGLTGPQTCQVEPCHGLGTAHSPI